MPSTAAAHTAANMTMPCLPSMQHSVMGVYVPAMSR